jgi:hypothetical protein
LTRRLVIEADGPFHDPDHDARRDRWLATQGFHVLRFTNAEILNDGFRVIDAIRDTAPLLPSREKVAAKPTDEGANASQPNRRIGSQRPRPLIRQPSAATFSRKGRRVPAPQPAPPLDPTAESVLWRPT